MPRIAFYAPLKPPDHPVPSGDREMARLLLAALREAGFDAAVASTLRMSDSASGRNLPAEARVEIMRLLAQYQAQPRTRPDLWFTYHVYYKAPDLIGPAIAQALGIPYVIAEGSRAPKRARGPYAAGHAQAEAALDAADLILIPNPNDRAMLEAARPQRQILLDLPPFLDTAGWPRLEHGSAHPPCRLLTVAMMRAPDKLASYTVLAKALALLGDTPDWRLDIIGDGPARNAVETLFEPFGSRVTLHGRIDDRLALARFYADANMLVWPAVNEAFGMVFLEAALQGCPSIAGDFGGVGTVVRDGRTGLLTQPGDAADFAGAMGHLMRDDALGRTFSTNALVFARQERSLAATATLLRRALLALIEPARPVR